MIACTFRRLLLGLLTSLALTAAGIVVPVIPAAVMPAFAQVSAEFQEALEPYGHWARSARFGEVWVPDELPPDWRPYEYGHWVYTDEWGWYWISDPEEQDWGWVVFHYGRWAFERGLGWFWIPNDEWGPAWVDWRYGGDYVGWAPLPPDDDIVEYDDEPAYWVFVSPRYLGEPRWRRYRVPQDRRAAAFGRTRVVNRSVGFGRGRAAVNPGISPAFVARVSRAAVPTYRVSPRVLAGTQGVAGAVRVSPDQLRAGQAGGQRGRRPSTNSASAVAVQRTSAVALPVGPATAPQPLNKGERGKLGSHPPRAAQGASPTPLQQQQQQQQQQQPLRQQQVPQQQPPPPGSAPPVQPPVQRQELPAQRHEPPPAAPPPPVEHRERPPEPQQHAPPAAPPATAAPPRPIVPQTPPPAAVHRPEPPPAARPQPQQPPPHPQPPAAARPEPPAARPAPPPQAAKPPSPPAAKPAPKPEEKKKDEPPK